MNDRAFYSASCTRHLQVALRASTKSLPFSKPILPEREYKSLCYTTVLKSELQWARPKGMPCHNNVLMHCYAITSTLKSGAVHCSSMQLHHGYLNLYTCAVTTKRVSAGLRLDRQSLTGKHIVHTKKLSYTGRTPGYITEHKSIILPWL